MLNLYSKLRRILSEKNEKWVGEKIGYMLDISWFLKTLDVKESLNNNIFDVDTVEVQGELIS